MQWDNAKDESLVGAWVQLLVEMSVAVKVDYLVVEKVDMKDGL